MKKQYELPSINNPKQFKIWVVKHFKMDDPNSSSSLSDFKVLKDDQLTIPLSFVPELPVGYEPGETGPNPRMPTPEKEPYCNITQDALYPIERQVDQVVMRKKLDHITVFCNSLVETGKTITDSNGVILREISVTFNQPWQGIGNGGNRVYAIIAAQEIAAQESAKGKTAPQDALNSQYMDIVFSRGYTESQARQISHTLNEANKVEAWAQLHHAGKINWFIKALDGEADGYDKDKYLKELNPNFSKRIRFISGADSALNVEEALQVLQMFNREAFPHKESKALKVHASRSSITSRLSKDNDQLSAQLQKLAPVSAYLLMIHDYIRLNAINWCAPQTQLGFLDPKESNFKNIIFLEQEKQQSFLDKKKVLVRSLAHPLCFGLSQYLNKNSRGDWNWLSTYYPDGNGIDRLHQLQYRDIISIIDEVGPSYMAIISERFEQMGFKKEVSVLMRDDKLWEGAYDIIRQYLDNQTLWKPAALLTEPPKKLLIHNKYNKRITSSPKPAVKVVKTLTAN